MRNRLRPWICGALGLLLWGACDRDEESLLSQPVEEEAALTPGGGGVPSSAVAAIVDARCARERRCGNIGPGQTYPSPVECTTSIRAEWTEELNRVECPRGIDEGALAGCLRELTDDRCNETLDAVQRWTACRATNICARPTRSPLPLVRDRPVSE